MSRIFTHIKTGNLYKVLGSARCVKNPKKTKIIYEQLYESTLRGSSEVLPAGTMWMRTPHDFQKKFALTTLDESTVNAYLISKQKQDKNKVSQAFDAMDGAFNVGEIVSEVGGTVLKTVEVVTDLGSKVVKNAGKIVKHIDDIST